MEHTFSQKFRYPEMVMVTVMVMAMGIAMSRLWKAWPATAKATPRIQKIATVMAMVIALDYDLWLAIGLEMVMEMEMVL